MDAIRQGVLLSVYGIGVTFVVLGALILLIRVLLSAFPVTEAEEHPTEDPYPAEEEAHVAVAAAWWYLNQPGNSGLGTRLEEGRGPWWDKNPE